MEQKFAASSCYDRRRDFVDSMGKKRTRRGKLAVDFMRGIGPSVTYKEVLEHLNSHGESLTDGSFSLMYREVFRKSTLEASRGAVQEGIIDRTDSQQEDVIHAKKVESDLEECADELIALVGQASQKSLDHLDAVSAFCRFAAAVDGVGGIIKARQLLTEMERVYQVMEVA